jgi:hypothetical protein
MKKIIFVVSIVLTICTVSCDQVFDYNYYVKNLTPENIVVVYETGNGIRVADTITIKSDEEKLIYVSNAAGGQKLLGQTISIVFNKFVVKKGHLESLKNYRDNQIWQYIETSSNIGRYTLIVDSSHFEKLK